MASTCSLLRLAYHDTHLLTFCVGAVDVDSTCNYLDSESNALGNLQQNYFYLTSKFARTVLTMPPGVIPPRIEIAQCIRMQLLITIREHQYESILLAYISLEILKLICRTLNFESIIDLTECYLNGIRCISELDWHGRSAVASLEICDALYHVMIFLVRVLIVENHQPFDSENGKMVPNHKCRSLLISTFTYFFDLVSGFLFWHCNDEVFAVTVAKIKTSIAFHSLLKMWVLFYPCCRL